MDTNGSNVVSPTIGATNVVPPMAIPVQTTSVPHREKPEKFSGVDFKRWQQTMIFYLITLNLARFLSEDPPVVQEGTNNRESLIALDVWKTLRLLVQKLHLKWTGQYTIRCI
ncbi:CCHC-type domain-containing protein [Abeliophyllum distichum]|uniref:CCHC-type domain-containing protein n=1 Tax=Abeliophyllum distichum TaxID=126358 RepID=A0ABD1TI09_9LAMI